MVSLVLRRDGSSDAPEAHALRDALAGNDIVTTTGIILQELLQGAVPARSRDQIVERFSVLQCVEPTLEDHVAAADLRNSCRRAGVQLGTVDALIARLAIRHRLTLLITDKDFHSAARHIPLRVWTG